MTAAAPRQRLTAACQTATFAQIPAGHRCLQCSARTAGTAWMLAVRLRARTATTRLHKHNASGRSGFDQTPATCAALLMGALHRYKYSSAGWDSGRTFLHSQEERGDAALVRLVHIGNICGRIAALDQQPQHGHVA